MSLNVFMPVVCHATQIETSSLGLPIQVKWVASNYADLLPNIG